MLRGFRYDGGGSWVFRSLACDWTPNLPTDAQLMMHAFCAFMDTLHRDLQQYPSERPFSQRYVYEYPEPLPNLRGTEEKEDAFGILDCI